MRVKAKIVWRNNKKFKESKRQMIMDVIECIRQRRSVRQYNERPIDKTQIEKLLKAAISAPSGKNRQPWKFSIVSSSDDINQLAKVTVFSRWMRKAKCCIIVYLDKSCSYDYIKDMQSCGASIQNILLAAHSMGIGSCWVGEVMGKDDEIKALLGIQNNDLKVVGIVTLGYCDMPDAVLNRRQLDSFIVYRNY